MMTSLHLDPLVPWIFWFALSGLCFVGVSVGVIRHLRGWYWRMVSLVILLLALLQPSLMQQEREYLKDIVMYLQHIFWLFRGEIKDTCNIFGECLDDI